MNKHSDSALLRLLTSLAGRLPLRLVFSLPFLVQFLLAALLIGLLLFRGGQQAVDAVLIQLRLQVLERIHEQMDDRMREPLRLNRLNADAWKAGILNLDDEQKRDRYFVSHLKAFPEAAMAFIGLPDGSFYGARRKDNGAIEVVHNNQQTGGASWYYSISAQGDAVDRQAVFPNFDPRTRPWYQIASRNGAPSFSPVYRHFVFREPTVTAAHPIYDDHGQLAGVFGVDYLLSWLSNMLRGLPLGKSGQVFIIDSEGLLVAASALPEPFEEQNGQIQRIKAIESNNGVLRQAVLSQPNNSVTASWEYHVDGRQYFVDSRPFAVSGTNWTIFVVLAADDYLSGLQAVAQNTAILTAGLILLTFLLAVWTSGWVTTPIRRLNTAARELIEGRFRAVPETSRRDEVGQLTHSFNRMGNQLTDLVANLEAKVEARTADLAAKTQEEYALREMYQAELAQAGRMQRTLVPEDIDNERLKLQVIYEPFLLVSGDMCGYHWHSKDSVLFGYIVDVTGHGVATALHTAAMNVMLQEVAHSRNPLDSCLHELNRRVMTYFGEDMLVAAFCFEIDFQKGELRYCAAGIMEFFAVTAGFTGRQATPGSLLGVSNHPFFDVGRLPIEAGDQLYFYSDGLADRLTAGQEIPILLAYTDTVQALRQIGAAGVRHDDVTVLCIEIGEMESNHCSYYVSI